MNYEEKVKWLERIFSNDPKVRQEAVEKEPPQTIFETDEELGKALNDLFDHSKMKIILDIHLYLPGWHGKYANKITFEAWCKIMDRVEKQLTRAIEVFDGYYKTGDEVLFDLSLEVLNKAHKDLAIIKTCLDKEDSDKLSHFQTFLYHLAGAI